MVNKGCIGLAVMIMCVGFEVQMGKCKNGIVDRWPSV